MPLSLLQSIVRTCVAATRPTQRHRSAAGLRSRAASMGLESLEQRMALTVAAPSIRLAAASDTGVLGDGITRLARPVFSGTASPRSSVVVYADGQLVGITTATVRGAWSLATPAARPLTTGAHTMTAYAVGAGSVWSTATPMWMAVDPTPPTASLTYDSVNGRATVTFSEPVSGVRVSSLILSGRTQSGVTIPNMAINDVRARPYVGLITMSQSSDGRTFTFQEQLTLAEPGTYTLSFVRTGVTDRAGNLPAAGVSTRFTII
jgi:Bacterial Ig-like domain